MKKKEPTLTATNENVVTTQRDRRRLKCIKCGETTRPLGTEEMPSPEQFRAQFDWVVRYNAAVEKFLREHEHKEVQT